MYTTCIATCDLCYYSLLSKYLLLIWYILITKLWKNPTIMIIMFIIIITCQNIFKRLWKIKLIFVTQHVIIQLAFLIVKAYKNIVEIFHFTSSLLLLLINLSLNCTLFSNSSTKDTYGIYEQSCCAWYIRIIEWYNFRYRGKKIFLA